MLPFTLKPSALSECVPCSIQVLGQIKFLYEYCETLYFKHTNFAICIVCSYLWLETHSCWDLFFMLLQVQRRLKLSCAYNIFNILLTFLSGHHGLTQLYQTGMFCKSVSSFFLGTYVWNKIFRTTMVGQLSVIMLEITVKTRKRAANIVLLRFTLTYWWI